MRWFKAKNPKLTVTCLKHQYRVNHIFGVQEHWIYFYCRNCGQHTTVLREDFFSNNHGKVAITNV